MSIKRDQLDETMQEHLHGAYGGDLDEFRTDVQDILQSAADMQAFEAAGEEDETENYTAIGFWNDQDEITIVGIIRGVHQRFGGETCTEGGPWAASFHAASDDQAEYMAEQHAEAAADAARNSTDYDD